jgi:pyruvate dehydrogenase E2 component (dihydrolipoamide acetyltransferase)
MPTEIIMPKVDMVMETGTFVEWLKPEGQAVEKGEMLFVILTDKATIECESPARGILAGVIAKPGDVIPVTGIIGYILAPGESLPAPAQPAAPAPAVEQSRAASPETQAAAPAVSVEKAPRSEEKLLRATPLARKMARELGIDLAKVSGRGPYGRIYKADILVSSQKGEGQKPAAVIPSIPLQPFEFAPGFTVPLPDASVKERVPFKGIRAIIAQRLSYSSAVIPHIYETITVEMNEIYRLREKCAPGILAETGIKLTYTAILAFIISRVLPKHPYLNSSLANDEIILWEDVNLGLATDLDDYLIVPVIKKTQGRDLRDILKEIGRLLEAARGRKLGPEEMRNGTFTISNLGMFGIESFTAIINPPEAAILSVGKIEEIKSTCDGQDEIRRTMKLVLGADHRIVDGAKAARFLMDLKAAIENPYLLF